MVTLPPSGYMSDPVRKEGEMKVALEELRDAIDTVDADTTTNKNNITQTQSDVAQIQTDITQINTDIAPIIPKTGTHSIELTFDSDEVVTPHTQTGPLTYTLSSTGNNLFVGKRIQLTTDDTVTFNFTVGAKSGDIDPTKTNIIYMLYVGDDVVDINIVNMPVAP